MFAFPWRVVYEGEGAGDAGAAAGGAGGAGGAAAAGAGAAAGAVGKMFTQEDVNTIMAENKRNLQSQLQKTVTDLETLKKTHGLTEKQKTELEVRIQELNNSMLSKEELAQKDRERLKNEHKTQLDALTGERDTWRDRYTSSTILRAITDAAVKEDAFSPEQVAALLHPNTRLAEEVDGENKPTGSFVAKVKFHDEDKQGKPIVLDITVPEAVKRMKELVPRFGNLFKATATGGLGSGRTDAASRGQEDPSSLSPEQYREWRKKQNMSTVRSKGRQ